MFMPILRQVERREEQPLRQQTQGQPDGGGAAPKIRNRVEPRMKCTSETPTG